jgi:uncharacterized membrane protein (UPF0127 family)
MTPDSATMTKGNEAVSHSSGYAFNVARETFLATAVSVADTQWTRLRGLIGTRRDEFYCGMALWIRPCQSVHTMFMNFPIDIVYLDSSFRVLRVDEHVQPWRVTPMIWKASSVIELPAGTVSHTGTQVGDQLEITHNSLQIQPHDVAWDQHDSFEQSMLAPVKFKDGQVSCSSHSESNGQQPGPIETGLRSTEVTEEP